MRLTEDQAQAIKQLAYQIAGERAHVRVFGSRLDDSAKLLRLPIHDIAFKEGKTL